VARIASAMVRLEGRRNRLARIGVQPERSLAATFEACPKQHILRHVLTRNKRNDGSLNVGFPSIGGQCAKGHERQHLCDDCTL
jgi:hypothetical protein